MRETTGSVEMTDDSTGDEPGLTWGEVFSWIPGIAGLSGHQSTVEQPPWWDAVIEAPGSPERYRKLALVSDLALERLPLWRLGQIFPTLSPETGLDQLPVSTRAQNVFSRNGFRKAEDLQPLLLRDFLVLPQVGVGTVDSIVKALADAAIFAETSATWGAQDSVRAPHDHPTIENTSPVATGLLEDFRVVARWNVAIGIEDVPLLDEPSTLNPPSSVAEARARIRSLLAEAVLSKEGHGQDATILLEQSLAELSTRAQEIVARRFFADAPQTLDELGRELGITRERVRQIEGKARAEMTGFLAPASPLSDIASVARDRIGTVLPLQTLLDLMPALSSSVAAVGQPAWRVLDRLDDNFEIEDGWCAVPTILAARTLTQVKLQEISNDYGVARIDEVELIPSDVDPDLEMTTSWLVHCGYLRYGELIFTRTQSVGDRAAAVLSATGSPLTSQEILDHIGAERSLGSLKNGMSVDTRFERVDRDKWALSEWKLDSYGGIRDLVRAEVSRNGGQIEVESLVERLTAKYSVSASSVVAYASSPPFESNGGVVRLGRNNSHRFKSPARTRRLYRHEDGWYYRIKVTADHLRGSGSVAPTAIASILKLEPGETRLLDSALGQQPITWTGNQPGFGSIRRFLIDGDISIDSEIFIVVSDDSIFSIEPVASRGDKLADALALAGCEAEPDWHVARQLLAAAIQIPNESPLSSIIGGFSERGDNDIADLLLGLEDEPDTEPDETYRDVVDVSDILDLL